MGSAFGSAGARLGWGVAAALAVALGALGLWSGGGRRAELESLERQRSLLAAERAKLDLVRRAGESRLRTLLVEQSKEGLLLTGLALSRVAPEALASPGPAGEGPLLRQLAAQPSVRRVAWVGAEGRIEAATDPELEGQPASRFFWGLEGLGDRVQVQDAGEDLVLVAPLLGAGSDRAGTLLASLSKASLTRRAGPPEAAAPAPE